MESLNKQQIVLLTLLGQVPQGGVTQTINNVIEKTVEKVTTTDQTASLSSKTVNILVEDQIADSVSKIKKSIVKIKNQSTPYNTNEGIGLIVSKDLVIFADKSLAPYGVNISAVFPDGQEFPLQLIQVQSYGDIAFLLPIIPTEKKKNLNVSPIVFSDQIRLGQTVLSLSGKDGDELSQGFIDKINSDNSTTTNSIFSISTNIPIKKSNIGSVLFTIDGNVLGFKTTSLVSDSSNLFYPLSLIRLAIPKINP